VVTTQAGRDLAEGLGIPFFETSAKVAEPFVECARRALGTLRGDKAPAGGAFPMFDASMMFDKLESVSLMWARDNMPPSLLDVGTHVTTLFAKRVVSAWPDVVMFRALTAPHTMHPPPHSTCTVCPQVAVAVVVHRCPLGVD
jgi:hypothetical protein